MSTTRLPLICDSIMAFLKSYSVNNNRQRTEYNIKATEIHSSHLNNFEVEVLGPITVEENAERVERFVTVSKEERKAQVTGGRIQF